MNHECKTKYVIDPQKIEFAEDELLDFKEQMEAGVIHAEPMEKHFYGSEDKAMGSDMVNKNILFQNAPNPGNPFTTIRFQLIESGHVVMTILNLRGQEVKTLINEQKTAGSYSVLWDGKDYRGFDMPSGLYIYMMKIGEHVFIKKLTLMK